MAKRKPSATLKSQAAVAKHFGVSERTVASWFAAGCPGETGKYNIASITAWRNKNRRREPPAGSKGIWEERYKKEKAKMARLDRLRRQGELVDRSAAITCWVILARRLQQVGSSLQKVFGPAAVKMLNEAIEDCKREVEATFPDDGFTSNVGDCEK